MIKRTKNKRIKIGKKKNKKKVYYNWSSYHLKNQTFTISYYILEKAFRAKLAMARLLKGLQKIIKFRDPQEDEKASRVKSSMARLLFLYYYKEIMKLKIYLFLILLYFIE